MKKITLNQAINFLFFLFLFCFVQQIKAEVTLRKVSKENCLTGINADQGTAWKDRTRICIDISIENFLNLSANNKDGALGAATDWTNKDELYCSGLGFSCWERIATNTSPEDNITSTPSSSCACDEFDTDLGYVWNKNCRETIRGNPCCLKEGESGFLCSSSEKKCNIYTGYKEDSNRYCELEGQICCSNSTSTKQNPDLSSKSGNNANATSNNKTNSNVSTKNQSLTTAQKQSFCDGSPKTTEVAKNPQNYDSNVLTYEECIAWSKTDTTQFQKFIAENNVGVSTAWKDTLTKIQSQIKSVDGVSSGVFNNISNEIKQMDSIIQQQQKQYTQNLNKFIETGTNVKLVSNPLSSSVTTNPSTISPTSTKPIANNSSVINKQPVTNTKTATLESYVADCKQAATKQQMSYYIAENGTKCATGFVDIIDYSQAYNLHCCGITFMVTQCTNDKGILREKCLDSEQIYAQWQTTSGLVYCCSQKK